MDGVPRAGRLDLVQLWDGRWWPSAGSFAELPVFRFRAAPSGLATRRQLRCAGLCPGGQDVAGWLAWGRYRRPRWAYLYRLDLARRKRALSEAQRAALAKATEAARRRHYCRSEHQFGEWMACGCGQAIADHQDPALGPDDWCEFEFRTCRFCPASQERRITDIPTDPNLAPDVAADVEDGEGVRRPGGPSAKTSHRAGWSPNHHSSSKENPMVEPPSRRHEITETPETRNYPITPAPEQDPRFTLGLLIDVRDVLLAHGYAPCTGADITELRQVLAGFLYGAQGGLR